MINFLFSPFLWLRKVLLRILIFLALLVFVLYFVAHSPMLITKIANKYAPDYNLSFERIYGNAITGIEIDNLSYKNQPLAGHIILHWNPAGLLKKELIVSNLTLEKTEVDNIKDFITSFQNNSNAEDKKMQSKTTSSFPFRIKAHTIVIKVEPFEHISIALSKIALEVDDLIFDKEGVEIEDLALEIESNLTKLYLQASWIEDDLEIETLEIIDLNTLALEKLLTTLNNKENNNSKPKEKIKETHKKQNSFIPKNILINTLLLTLLPRDYEPLEIQTLNLYGSEIYFDIEKLLLQKARIRLEAQSNFTTLSYPADIRNNKIYGKLHLEPTKTFFDRYIPTLNPKALETIDIDLNASKKSIIAGINTQIMQILKVYNIKPKPFNLDILKLKSRVVYDLETFTLNALSSAYISTPHTKDLNITNHFNMDENSTFTYNGEIQLSQIMGVNAKFVKPLQNLSLNYEGNNTDLFSRLNASNIKGSIALPLYQKADIHIESKEDLLLREFVKLPTELNQTKAKLSIDVPLSFEENATLLAFANITSNLLNIDANISYRDNLSVQALSVQALSHIPKNSLLKGMNKELKWKRLTPLALNFKQEKQVSFIKLKNKALDVSAKYDNNNTKLTGEINLVGIQAKISGHTQEKIKIKTKIASFSKLIEEIKKVYTLKKPPLLKGKGSLDIEIKKLKEIKLLFSSPQISYKENSKSKKIERIKDIAFEVLYAENKILLKNYALEYEKQKIFAKKTSHIFIEEDKISLLPFWINDALHIIGNYDKKQNKAVMDIQADNLPLSHKVVELNTDIKLKASHENNKTNIQGKVLIDGGKIHYNLSQKRFAHDADIQIKKRGKKEKSSAFMDNLSAMVQIEMKKPLVYNEGAISMRLQANIAVQKEEKKPLKVYGAVEILKGGRYIFQNKRFILNKSYIYFTGDPSKPLLEASIKYQTLDYLVTVRVTGSPEAPNIHFSSSPYLNEEQILSLILFDSVSGADSNSGTDMMRMMGGAMAKSALSNIGVKLDHLVLGEGNSIEVGKKISNRVTIIYVNDIVSSVRVKYQHNTRTQSVINMNEESQSYDIIYKDDFSLDLF